MIEAIFNRFFSIKLIFAKRAIQLAFLLPGISPVSFIRRGGRSLVAKVAGCEPADVGSTPTGHPFKTITDKHKSDTGA